ncbi:MULTISPECIES: bifunctional UDP-N-acetylglucosamine diphosphorylase/glucosamine-1-phosphate N-acetyltransferase GlmU [Glycomyces]|uniref:Bifunctional protein GlmU n=1 Tax=Glycomyces artemisiae TaxID=1076443 RepID=A0A2T0UIR4_9ACTN|nr:bifunctional UDP-N-acetylglucosamine diphosphorylase/glucosamine-1-phosphate N-acetyltransferase GlmU [Glycomyces artemisiae]NUQ87008.1 bifunctional UDP-N-acetylglucosamine diphosphorylase/glucosamine-1-phosphate N-acetyltransferase GlmU [Glycomyces artemisiae]PRY57774.1 bifunctional UDP-N-acetylglucosamine pyrophosphorylase/glucosamine-1-phosphate N-acetyltransferase [Glycomyces artemisiae]
MSSERSAIILAAGLGTRMKSTKPKVLHEVLGRTLVGHVLRSVRAIRPERQIVVVGAAADQVRAHLAEVAPEADTVFQDQQLGTGHAVRIAMDANPDLKGTVVVAFGDAPLLRSSSIAELVEVHEKKGNAVTVLTAVVDDPTGLGRIVRDNEGNVLRNVEHRDADHAELAIREINSGTFACDADVLREQLDRLSTANDQGEYYLTDIIELAREAGHTVGAVVVDDPTETLGCNDRAQLADLRRILQGRINTELMKSGVTMDDPATTWIDATVKVAPDVLIRPGVQLKGATAVDSGAEIGPDTTLTDTIVGAGAEVVRSHAVQAHIGEGAHVGPFAHLRPASKLAERAKVGAFVETKNAEIGAGAKANHLAYLGDATVGADANIGCGVITANYDGLKKHRTEIGEGAFIGCDTTLVAPVSVGDGAYVGAGSTIVKDVEPGDLAVARARQAALEDWVAKKRPGTVSDKAARRAKGEAGVSEA